MRTRSEAGLFSLSLSRQPSGFKLLNIEQSVSSDVLRIDFCRARSIHVRRLPVKKQRGGDRGNGIPQCCSLAGNHVTTTRTAIGPQVTIGHQRSVTAWSRSAYLPAWPFPRILPIATTNNTWKNLANVASLGLSLRLGIRLASYWYSCWNGQGKCGGMNYTGLFHVLVMRNSILSIGAEMIAGKNPLPTDARLFTNTL